MARNERAVSVLAGINGTLTSAKRADAHPHVVMLHGFGGNRDETGDLFKKLAQRLADAGLSSLRFDFPGCGDSEGEFGDVTVPLYRRIAISALRYAKSSPGSDPKRLALLGYSFGGAIATSCLKGDAPHARALVLWAPVGDPRVDMVVSLGAERAAEAERTGKVTVPWGKGTIRLKREFFRSLAEIDPIAAISVFDGGVYVAAGSLDRLAPYVAKLYDAAKSARLREKRIIEGADHFFGANERRSPLAETLLAETTAFLVAGMAK